jgi:hypothetical protein
VLELGTVDSSCFIAMEYVDGESLGALIKASRIAMPISARIISQAAMGIHAAHELRDNSGTLLGVVHRDVSPQNVLLSYDGVVKVVDFGVAKARSNVADTETGTVKGKFGYMAPEQIKPDQYGKLDRRSDVFSLGILLYEATTRRNLFKTQTDGQTIDRVLNKKVKPPSRMIPDYPAELEAIVMKALQRGKEDRYQTAHEMHVDLEAYIARCGDPVLQSSIADLMHFVFAERMERKEAVLRLARESTPLMDASSSLHTLRGSSVSARVTRPKRGLALGIVIGLVALVGLGVGAMLLLRDTPPASKAETPVRPPRRTQGPIVVEIRATPQSATIRFDGRDVPNPFKARRRREKRTAKVEVRAAGHVPKTIELPLDEGGRLMVALEKLPPVPPPVAKVEPEPEPEPKPKPKHKRRSRRRWRKGRGKTKGKTKGRTNGRKKSIKNLLKNPYDS